MPSALSQRRHARASSQRRHARASEGEVEGGRNPSRCRSCPAHCTSSTKYPTAITTMAMAVSRPRAPKCRVLIRPADRAHERAASRVDPPARCRRCGIAGSVGAWWGVKFLQKRREVCLDRLFQDIVLGLETLPDCQQPRPLGQDLSAFLVRVQSLSSWRYALIWPRHPSTTLPILLGSSVKLYGINRHR